MPAKSKAQQRFFGVVKAMQSGDIPKKGAAGKAAKDMSDKEVDKYASTKHKGLPMKVKGETVLYRNKRLGLEIIESNSPFTLQEAEYQGRKVTLNKPFRTPDGPKKSSVYVKNAKGNVVKVNFGDPNMRIKKNIPGRRKNFRARHNCDNPGPKWKARYWSCKAW